MKFIFTLILSVSFFTAAFAADDIRISTKEKNSKVELNFTSASQKNKAVVITITDKAGNIVVTKDATMAFGENKVSICDVKEMKEGQYTVKMINGNKTSTTQFIIWK